jgi:glycerol-3-phosphate dehydrogenase
MQLAKSSKLGAPLAHGHPVLEAEVVYAARHEFCATASDFLARRSRLAFLDAAAAKQASCPHAALWHMCSLFRPLQALPRVVQLLGDELRWSGARRRQEAARAAAFLDTFAL